MSQLNASFSNLTGIKSFRYTKTLGHTPDMILMRGIPQARLQSSISDVYVTGALGTMFIPDCLLDSASLTMDDEDGHVAVYRILDRRWRWRYGAVSVVFNLRDPEENIIPETEATPRQIANFLLRRAGERDYDTSALPNEDRPLIDMTDDNPMEVLHDMCRKYGCSIAINGWRTSVVKIGEGPPLPTGYIKSIGYGIDPPELPSFIRVSGGELVVQGKLKLEAVAKETNGQILPLADISWLPEDYNFSPNYPIPDEEEDIRALAKETLFRWYRVKAQADDTQDIPGYTGEVTKVTSIYPVGDRLLDYTEVKDKKVELKPFVEGVFWIQFDDPNHSSNTTEGTIYPYPFKINQANGVIEFDRPVYKIIDEVLSEADLWITTTFPIRDEETNQHVNYVRERKLGDFSGGTMVIKRPDMIPKVIIRYDEDNPDEYTEIEKNETALNERADQVIDDYVSKLEPEESYLASYADIQNIQSNGANRQITWIVSDTDEGAITNVYRNIEGEPGVLREWERNVVDVAKRAKVEKEVAEIKRRREKERGS